MPRLTPFGTWLQAHQDSHDPLAIAAALGVTRQCIDNWKYGRSTPRLLVKVMALTGLSARDLTMTPQQRAAWRRYAAESPKKLQERRINVLRQTPRLVRAIKKAEASL